MKYLLLALAVVALAISGSSAQPLPTQRPAACDGSSCQGCGPFQPPAGAVTDDMCGVDDVYFPVPILVNRMDTTAGEPLVSQQWACFACCALGCGFDNSGSTCATRNYVYVANGTYGCTKCGGGDVKNPGAGTVKTSFQDFSTKDVYSVITQPYQGCGVAPPPTPPTTPMMSPPTTPAMVSPSPSPSPSAVAPTGDVPPVVIITPPPVAPIASPSPVAMLSPPPPPMPIMVPAPAPAPEAPAPSPPFVPINITSTPPAPSAGSAAGTAAALLVAAAVALLA